MSTVNMLAAKSQLSRLVEAVESGTEQEVIIARNGKPAAKLVPITKLASGQRLGIAKGQFRAPENIDVENATIITLLSGMTR